MVTLALDVGDARIGTALCDELMICARPHTIIERQRNCYREILALCQEYNVKQVVIGLPLETDGTEGSQAKRTRRFGDKLTKALLSSGDLKNILVEYRDERFTTAQSERVLQGSKLQNKERSGALDRISASFILEAYLEEKRRQQ